jgi:RND family efflux transporter MFP subunit
MIKNLLKKPIPMITGLILIFGLIYSANAILGNNDKIKDEAEIVLKVKTVNLELNGHNKAVVETVGTVKAKTKVDVVALSKGTVRNIFFSIGDEVFQNKTLVSLSDSLTLSNLISAETNFSNMQNNQTTANRLAYETVRQAELGVQAALDSVEAAEIGVSSARDNLNNYLALRDRTNEDVKNNAVTAYSGYLNSVFNALDQIDSIIKADESELRPSSILLNPSIGAKDLNSLPNTRLAYKNAKLAYLSANGINPENTTIQNDFVIIVDTMEKTKDALAATVVLLDNTATNLDITESWLSAQKSSFIGLKSSIVASIQTAKSTMQALNNTDLVDTQSESSLSNALLAAENRLSSAKINYQNSLAALENAKQGSDQQKISAQSALDNSRSQLNLAQIQADDLSIRAPIAGTITNKTVELGMEINPGMKIAEISQTDLLTIETDISSEDIGRINIGEEVKLITLQDELTGVITKIFPTADPITKKVRVEIAYVNNQNKLIPEAFVDVVIPINEELNSTKSLYIPLRAVIITANENYVFVVEEEQAKKTTVELGETKGTEIEILSGLNDTDELIVDGAKLVDDGERVEVIK